ncbi:MAG: hypothetical protein V3V41_00310 [Candidatus Heimdallarchaeota archaeon]
MDLDEIKKDCKTCMHDEVNREKYPCVGCVSNTDKDVQDYYHEDPKKIE